MQDITIAALIAELKKPGKLFTTMCGTELLVEVVKADMIATLQGMLRDYNTNEKPFTFRRATFGMHIEANR